MKELEAGEPRRGAGEQPAAGGAGRTAAGAAAPGGPSAQARSGSPAADDPAGRNRRIDALFAEALGLAPARRLGFLREACGGDAGLRREVEELIAASEVDDTFLEPGGAAAPGLLAGLLEGFSPGSEAPPAASPGSAAAAVGSPVRSPRAGLEGDPGPAEAAAGVAAPGGQVVGRYRLIEELGRGGMGVVYLAERADGVFDQRVALKLLRFGSDRAAAERFGRERQILAQLEHPHIARLIDGGLTAAGQPYLVMEYVAGLPIDQYCRERRLDLGRRIALLAEVCEAVEAAHRQLIVHRDLKPSNILVRDDGEVRLLDFGIAKLLDRGEEDATLTVGRLLTPQYASPEQVRGGRITVASDVYQLGLLAFELFAGRRPYDLTGLGLTEAERKVCVEVPSRPSTVCRSRGEAAGEDDPYRPDPDELAGDLDLIVLKALHKEPERRYPSVEALRLDLERYLAGKPVSARPDVWTYRLRRFVGRHRWAVTAAAAVVAAVTLLVTGFVWRLAEERDQTRLEARRAEERRAETEEVTAFLIGLFEASNPIATEQALTSPAVAGADVTARDLLAKGREKLAGAFPDQPLVHARLLQAVGRIYRNLELYDEARPLLEKALALRRGAPGDHGPEVADSLADLGSLFSDTGRDREAKAFYRESLARHQAAYGEQHLQVARAKGNLANVLDRLGEFAESERLLTSAYETYEALGASEDEHRAWLIGLLAKARLQQGRADEAHRLFERALEIRRRLFGPDDYWVARSLAMVAMSHFHQGRCEQAIPLYREARRILELRLGPDSTRVAAVLENLAHCLYGTAERDQARPLMERALAIHLASRGGEESLSSSRLRYNLAHLKLLEGDAAGAELDLRRLQPILARLFDGPTEQSAMTWNDLGAAMVAQGRLEGAEESFRRSEDELLSLFGPGNKKLASPLLNRARLARRRGEPAAAEPIFRQGYEILAAILDPRDETLRELRLELAELLRELGREAEADALAPAAPAAAGAAPASRQAPVPPSP